MVAENKQRTSMKWTDVQIESEQIEIRLAGLMCSSFVMSQREQHMLF